MPAHCYLQPPCHHTVPAHCDPCQVCYLTMPPPRMPAQIPGSTPCPCTQVLSLPWASAALKKGCTPVGAAAPTRCRGLAGRAPGPSVGAAVCWLWPGGRRSCHGCSASWGQASSAAPIPPVKGRHPGGVEQAGWLGCSTGL